MIFSRSLVFLEFLVSLVVLASAETIPSNTLAPNTGVRRTSIQCTKRCVRFNTICMQNKYGDFLTTTACRGEELACIHPEQNWSVVSQFTCQKYQEQSGFPTGNGGNIAYPTGNNGYPTINGNNGYPTISGNNGYPIVNGNNGYPIGNNRDSRNRGTVKGGRNDWVNGDQYPNQFDWRRPISGSDQNQWYDERQRYPGQKGGGRFDNRNDYFNNQNQVNGRYPSDYFNQNNGRYPSDGLVPPQFEGYL